MSSLSKEWMGIDTATHFDKEVSNAISRFATEGKVELLVFGTVVWGRPQNGREK
ncbi:MAG: hypothetical protein NVS4B7_06250 [Ktedonobacteraceae bacterium]